MREQLIINTEFFLQCYGHCSGCFLTTEERLEKEIYFEQIKSGIEKIANKNYQINHLIIGFGRGNLLTLPEDYLEKLAELIVWCENNFKYQKITFEISTSLIGKLDLQIGNAKFLIQQSRNIYFNIVVNSEITSPSFWQNFKNFYDTIGNIRKDWTEDWGDILVLNVNPQKLPDLQVFGSYVSHHKSPININLFPFDIEQKLVLKSDMLSVIQWVEQLWETLKDKDFNMKNYLKNLENVDFDLNPVDLQNYYDNTHNAYSFIDKKGKISQGMSSIMGEVDFPRLLEKYNLKPELLNAYKKMQKVSACGSCDYQKECLVSGAFLNFLSNTERLSDKNICPSGYQSIFKLSKV